MIRLTLPPKPEQLTAELEQTLVETFKQTQNAVWNLPWLERPLLEMTNHKCAYCEQRLGEGVNITLDHYVHKSHMPERVADWENLLPCCQSCNSSKSTYNVSREPFLNPVGTEIQMHLEMSAGGMLKGITEAGRAVITRLKLNQSDQKAPPKFRLIQEMTKILEDCEDLWENLAVSNSARERTKLRNKVEALLNMAQPSSAFSAVAATILLHEPRFATSKECLERLNDWSPNLEQMLQVATQNALVLRVQQR